MLKMLLTTLARVRYQYSKAVEDLRVLLAKQPDISEPTFLTQYQIIYNMKSTYRINVPGTKI